MDLGSARRVLQGHLYLALVLRHAIRALLDPRVPLVLLALPFAQTVKLQWPIRDHAQFVQQVPTRMSILGLCVYSAPQENLAATQRMILWCVMQDTTALVMSFHACHVQPVICAPIN